MNDAHYHLVVNHLPIIFPLVGVIVLITGLISKSDAVKRTALMLFALGAICAFFAMSSGEGAEEAVENMSGVSGQFIEIHEESAEIFSILAYALGGLSLVGLWASFKQKSFSNGIVVGVLLFAFVVLFFAKQTGTTGGEIRHTEIRTTSTIPAAENLNTANDDDH